MFALVAVALACEPTLLAQFTTPSAPPAELTVENARATVAGVTYSGAQVTFRSTSPERAWQAVLEHPELQDEWHPKELGTEQVERIAGTDFYQRTAISVLGFTIRRQLIARVHWIEATPERLRTCWSAGDPTEFASRVQAWDVGSKWQRNGYGSWSITNLEDGGSIVAYQVWVDTNGIPTPLISWGVTRTLPTLLNAFEARADELSRRAGLH